MVKFTKDMFTSNDNKFIKNQGRAFSLGSFKKNKMKKIKIFLVSIVVFQAAFVIAQQDAQFTQYNDNMLFFNPAYAGSKDYLTLTALHRQQWAGIKGAPSSQTLTLHSPLRYESIGLGLSLLNDKVGPINQTWIGGDFSYSFKLKKSRKGQLYEGPKLSFGLKGVLNLLNGDLSQLYVNDQNDASLASNYSNKVSGNVGFGIFYRSKHFYMGASTPSLLEPKLAATDISFSRKRHMYFSIGGYFTVNRMLKVRPSAMVKIVEQAPVAIDVSTAFIFYDKFWLGLNHRVLESAGIYAQYQITKQFKIGYGFDISVNRLVKYNYGTHEIMLSFDLLRNSKDAIISPRFF